MNKQLTLKMAISFCALVICLFESAAALHYAFERQLSFFSGKNVADLDRLSASARIIDNSFEEEIPDYVFMPTDAEGKYTNPANWLNGNYPGTTIPAGKIVAFRKNGNYKFADVDDTVHILGRLIIEDSMHLEIPAKMSMIFGEPYAGFSFGLQLQSAYSSKVTINGKINGYGTTLQFGHQLLVNGLLSVGTSDDSDFIGSGITCDSAIIINGVVFGRVVNISSRIIQLSTLGELVITNGYDFNRNTVTVSTLLNHGTIDLDECDLVSNHIINNGSLLAHFLQLDSLLVNYGSFTISPNYHYEGEQVIGMRGSFQNFGTFSGYCNVSGEILLDSDIINAGEMNFSTGGSLNGGPLLFKRRVVNSHEIWIFSADARFEGSVINDATIIVQGQIEFISANCINNGTLSLSVERIGGANKILGNFLNTGTISNYGALQLGEKFINAGQLDIFPY